MKIVLAIIFLLTWLLIGMAVAITAKSKAAKPPAPEVVEAIPTTAVTSEPLMTDEPLITDEPPITEAVAYVSKEPIVDTDKALYTYEEMQDDLTQFAERYAEQIVVNTLSKTVDDRRLLEVIVGNASAPKKIVIQASIHGREYINTLLVMRQIEELLMNYDTGSYNGIQYSTLLDNVAFHIIPMANPDGVTISQMGVDGIISESLRRSLAECYEHDTAGGANDDGRYWEKWKANARGVDLNRNFDAGWQEFVGSSSPSSEKYKGVEPASEIETQAILALVRKTAAVSVISYHSAGNLIYWDYGSTGEIYEADRQLAQMVSAVTGYGPQSSIQSATDAAGCSDYYVLKEGIPAITIENGGGQCPLSINEFESIWNSNKELLPALAAFYQ